MESNNWRDGFVRRLYGALVRGDQTAILEAVTDDVEWVNPADAMEPGTHHGREGFALALRRLTESFVYTDLRVHEIHHVDDRVLVELDAHVTGRGSGAPAVLRVAHLLTMDEERVRRFEWFFDVAAARRAAGLD